MGPLADWPADAVPGLDPKLRLALDAQGPVPDFRPLGPSAVRASFRETCARTPKVGDAVARTEDHDLGGFRVRVYVPDGAAPSVPAVYFHGGGWVLGDLETHDDLCRSLCARSGSLLAAVDYRLAPEHPFPIPFEDAYRATCWLAERASRYGSDPARLAVCGDSAGGNLAAAVAQKARDAGGPEIALQALIYPVTDADFDRASYRAYASGFGLTAANMRWFWECYLGKGGVPGPLAAPLRAADLRDLPPAYFAMAEQDVLHDEGLAYAVRLREAGVPVRGTRYRGMNHGFLRLGALFPQALRAVDDLASALR
jgi:acetyl esterase